MAAIVWCVFSPPVYSVFLHCVHYLVKTCRLNCIHKSALEWSNYCILNIIILTTVVVLCTRSVVIMNSAYHLLSVRLIGASNSEQKYKFSLSMLQLAEWKLLFVRSIKTWLRHTAYVRQKGYMCVSAFWLKTPLQGMLERKHLLYAGKQLRKQTRIRYLQNPEGGRYPG